MKLCTGWVALWVTLAAPVLAATAADAQVLVTGAGRGPYIAASDFDGPYGPPVAPPPPRYGYDYGYGRAPGLLPPEEVYAVLRENGFSPLGTPRLRGFAYTIAVVDQRGDDGRLVIDARSGQIIRFQPAYGMGYGMGPAHDEGSPYGPQSALPPPTVIRGTVPRPPGAIPHVASRTVPLPREAPPRGDVLAAPAKPAASGQASQPPQQAATAQAKPLDKPAEASATPATVGQARPAPTILPTEQMPPAQGLD